MKKILIICFFIFSCDTQIQGVILEDHNYSKIIHEIYNDYSSNKYDLFYKYLDDDVIAYYSSESHVHTSIHLNYFWKKYKVNKIVAIFDSENYLNEEMLFNKQEN
jgi:hypothetical protein